jgi:hypothetical protein
MRFIQEEFNKQVQNILKKNYAQLAEITEETLLNKIQPLQKKLNEIATKNIDITTGKLPFVIVAKSTLIPAEKMMALVQREGKNGITKLFPHQSTDFSVIKSVELPENDIYLLVDIDRGKDTLNVRPEDALKEIEGKNRSPLTIDEGIALLTHYPDFLMKNNCFSLLASRHPGDQRVPAIWINKEKHPNLGWCWDRNPHTWLGSASCEKRIA